jgi:N utilization substance protein B
MSGLQKRQKARYLAVQAIYQWHVAEGAVTDIEAQFIAEEEKDSFDKKFFHVLLHGVIEHHEVIDEHLRPFVERLFENIDALEMSIIRLAAFELLHRPDVPYKVVINEYIELAKTFGEDESHKFVNGVVDKLAQKLRQVEIAGKSRK